jgi:tRNA threonylcarbamoyladenosine biosynthesis protein TsaB
MELAIDTSTEIASIALSRAGEVQAELTWPSGQNHTIELIPNLLHLLHQTKIELGGEVGSVGRAKIDAIIVAKGPGSFNGLRVGVGTAKGLAFALGIPLVGIGTLEVEAFPYAETGLPICPVQDAGRGEIAAAMYQLRNGKWQRLMAEHITSVEELCPKIAQSTLFCGRFSPTTSQQIERQLGERAIILKGTLRRAGFLAQLGWRRLELGDYDQPATLQPLYLRRPAITTPRVGKR